MKKKVLSLIMALSLVLAIGIFQAAFARELTSVSDAAVYIDGEATTLGNTLREWNGWHFVEANAFSGAFGFPIIADIDPDEQRGINLGVERRQIVFLLDETTDDWEVFGHLVTDALSRLTLVFSTVIDRDFSSIDLEMTDPPRLVYWSQSVANESRSIDDNDDDWDGGGYFLGSDFNIPLTFLQNTIQDERVLTGGLNEEDYENFPLSFIIDGNMYIPLEVACWFLGYSVTIYEKPNYAIFINTENTALGIRPTVSANNAVNLASASEWAYSGITSAVSRGFVPANIQNNFQSVITREEFCILAVSWVEYTLGQSIDTILTQRGLSRNPNAFTDTNDPAILAAYALGITSGVGEGRFDPQGNFTRQQAATMIMNTLRAIDPNIQVPATSTFADINTAAEWARPGISFVQANGIMSGTGDNNFSPHRTFTRQESIVTFNNIRHGDLPR